MNVRDLIANLLDYNMDAQVEIRIESKEDTEDVNFDFEGWGYSGNKYLYLTADLKDSIIVDASDYNDLKDEKEELASTVEDLRSKLEEAENQIYELERESK
ncbi:hypothetical protein ABD91_18005 [Lysinibacillus sphaericus]|uniref:hypothetical protein n=1 Tax=Lysinibacillus sphaericus TaxID=1421 RepID=UPI0018CD0303|nr:hypothetical protein [Lysinibacillus sphaericus]MBG9692674.1 hypothetical protein [Lysinibacillus sphaericus]